MRHAVRHYQPRCNEETELQAYHSTPRGYQMILRPILDLSHKPRRRATDWQIASSSIRSTVICLQIWCAFSTLPQRMPNVRKLGLSDRQWSKSRDWWHCSHATFCDHHNQPNIIQSGTVRDQLTLRIVRSTGLIPLAGMPLVDSILKLGIVISTCSHTQN